LLTFLSSNALNSNKRDLKREREYERERERNFIEIIFVVVVIKQIKNFFFSPNLKN
jgi:hypothetical protein